MTHSTIIITRNRPQECIRVLESLSAQTQPPDEVVLVDASTHSASLQEILDNGTWAFPLRFLRTEAGMAIQRNAGLDAAGGDILTFIDDDAVPEPSYCAEILRTFQDDAKGEIAAVGGLLLGHERSSGLELLFRRIFLLQTGAGKNQFRSSGFPDFDVSNPVHHPVHILPSTALSFRRSVSLGLRFDPTYFSGAPLGIQTGRCFGEDAWFVSQLSRSGFITLCSTARYVHPPSGQGRENRADTQALYVYAMRMLSAWRVHGVLRSPLRLWALGGQGFLSLFQALYYRDMGYLRGYGKAMRAPLLQLTVEGE